ncbi:MAG: YraN family protein [Pseudomonadota bacterium]
MKPRLRDQAGLAAEDIAERAYRARGGRVIARRWSCRMGEIDLIVAEAGVIVFVEVRARRQRAEAGASITPRKLARLMAAAGAWMSAEAVSPDSPMRLDAALVDRSGAVEIVENISL